ncbi:MAG: ATP-dependent DNA ligase [Dehalococcoidia bacterium]
MTTPRLDLPVRPPIDPMLAKRVDDIPRGDGWLFEPKWDGFRAIVFFDGERIYLQSRDKKPFDRYFPELAHDLPARIGRPLVLDGEIVIAGELGLDFDALQQRIHPAASRVARLAEETPATFVAFDLLATGDEALLATPFGDRRARLEAALADAGGPLRLTPATPDTLVAADWFERFEGAGFDGLIAKRLDGPYEPGVRSMFKIKHMRTVDCVVAGLRWAKDEAGTAVGSLLLGLYDRDGTLHYVGHTSSFRAPERRALVERLSPLITEDEGEGFGGGRTPGGESRWSRGKDTSWVRLRPGLVCEVTFDQLQSARFRHGSTFVRWRHDKPPAACDFDQLEIAPPAELAALFGG